MLLKSLCMKMHHLWLLSICIVARRSLEKTGHISDIHHSLHNTTYNNSDLVFDLPDFVDICRVHEYPRY